ncbi:hypothetical protein LSH36_463g04005 [Paralvinella palmiformis]|uniref:HTH CENPB-type domain-containing protein n=1 Tax=Paralvinella palmiformis TaxID=53620 RepID=A0AAD9MZ87_9ANNE|nr:hypothetical protein LSH36_463g04005 [Paralvinella palmiformis]
MPICSRKLRERLAEGTLFKASKSWFEKFKNRTGIHSVVRHGEPASSNVTATNEYIPRFKSLVDPVAYLPQQVFNRDEPLLEENAQEDLRHGRGEGMVPRDILKRRQKEISMNRFVVMRKFEPKMSESEPSVELEVIELATEPELEIVSVKPSTSHSDKEKEK